MQFCCVAEGGECDRTNGYIDLWFEPSHARGKMHPMQAKDESAGDDMGYLDSMCGYEGERDDKRTPFSFLRPFSFFLARETTSLIFRPVNKGFFTSQTVPTLIELLF